MPNARSTADPARHRGPSLVAVAATYVALFLVSVVLPTVIANGQHFPSPFEQLDASDRFFAEHSKAVHLMAFLQFGAAVPLGIFAAAATSRVQFLGLQVAGINIALFGGIGASLALALSAYAEWAVSQPGIVGSVATVRALHLLCFAAGGPGYVVPFGLLVAGISLVAGLQRFISPFLMWFGLATAAVAELSTIVFITPVAAVLLPLARFAGFAWMLLVGATLPKSKEKSRTLE